MTEQNVIAAVAYYKAYNEKNISEIEIRLHPEVKLISPLGELTGKQPVLEAVKRFLEIIKNLEVRTQCGKDDEVILVYDLFYGENNDVCRTAALINFTNGLIARLELFYDARPFSSL